MRSFNMGRFGNSDDPWFSVGNVDVNTTAFVTGLGVLSGLLWLLQGRRFGVLEILALDPDRVLRGQLWRIVTWPVVNDIGLFTLLLFFVFFMLGSQLEAAMGRRLFTTYLVALVVIPAVFAILVHLATNARGGLFGLRQVELGVLVGFAVRLPNARFWPGIPAWIIAAVIVVLNLFGDIGQGNAIGVVSLLATVAVALVGLRSLGFAEDAHWVPKVPLPAGVTGTTPTPKDSKPSTSKRKRRGRGKLSVAPPPSAATPRRELSRLDEAEMDAILDQVSEHGMDSLSPQQRQRLEEHAKRLRQRDQ